MFLRPGFGQGRAGQGRAGQGRAELARSKKKMERRCDRVQASRGWNVEIRKGEGLFLLDGDPQVTPPRVKVCQGRS